MQFYTKYYFQNIQKPKTKDKQKNPGIRKEYRGFQCGGDGGI